MYNIDQEFNVEISALLNDPARGYYLCGQNPPEELKKAKGQGFIYRYDPSSEDGYAILAQHRRAGSRDAQINFCVRWKGCMDVACLPSLKETMSKLDKDDIGEKVLRLKASILPGQPSAFLVGGMMEAMKQGNPCVLEAAETEEKYFLAAVKKLHISGHAISVACPLPAGLDHMDINLYPQNPEFRPPDDRRTVYILSNDRWQDYVRPETRKAAENAVKRKRRRSKANMPVAASRTKQPDAETVRIAPLPETDAVEKEEAPVPVRRQGASIRLRKLLLLLLCTAVSILMLSLSISVSPGMIVLFEEGSELVAMLFGIIWGAYLTYGIVKHEE